MSRSLGARSLTTSPPIFSSPSVMSSSPAISRSAVDLPQPEGPTRIMNSPSPISRSISFTASWPSGKTLVIPSRVISAMTALSLSLDRPGGEAGDDAALEEQDEDDDRHRHDHGGGRDAAGRFGEGRLAGEEGERG